MLAKNYCGSVISRAEMSEGWTLSGSLFGEGVENSLGVSHAGHGLSVTLVITNLAYSAELDDHF